MLKCTSNDDRAPTVLLIWCDATRGNANGVSSSRVFSANSDRARLDLFLTRRRPIDHTKNLSNSSFLDNARNRKFNACEMTVCDDNDSLRNTPTIIALSGRARDPHEDRLEEDEMKKDHD